MAYPTDSINMNRASYGVALPPEMANEVWQNAIEQSAIMQLAQRVQLPGTGVEIPVLIGDPSAEFVAETAEKPVSNSEFSTKLMKPYKIAVIELFSNELKRDLPALYDAIIQRAPSAIAKKFDATVFTGTAPGTGFDVLTNVATSQLVAGTGLYDSLVAAYGQLAPTCDPNGWAMSNQGIVELLKGKDGNGMPIFTNPINGGVSYVLGAPVVKASQAYAAASGDDDAILGYIGDWSKARWGVVDGIKVDFSEEATVNDGTNQINLWQRNMFAVRIEAEVGFVAAINAFRALTLASE